MGDLRPGVTVVIPTHNRPQALSALLGDLAGQRIDRPCDVVVVDSEAGADVSPVIESWVERGLNVRRILTDNIIAGKRNAGAAAGEGTLLVFLDDDMRVGPDLVQAHADAVLADPGSVSIGAVHFPDDWVARSNYYRFKDSRHAHGIAPEFLPAHRFVSMNFGISRPLFESLDGFDETFLGYGGEDMDFGIRCAARGIALKYNARADAEHCEVAMNVETYAAKVRAAAREGLTLVLERHPEAVQDIPTVRLCTGQGSRGERLVSRVVGVLAHDSVTRASVRALMRSDGRRRLYAPLAFKALTLVATRQGLDDRGQTLG